MSDCVPKRVLYMRELHLILLAICAIAPALAAQPDTSQRGVIRGIVLDTLGRPYSQIIVQLQRKTFDGLIPRRDTAWYLLTMKRYTTADDGRFEFAALERQVYTLSFDQSFLVSGQVDSVGFSESSDTATVELRARVRRPLIQTPNSVRERRLAGLADAKARWNARRVSSYQFAAKIECFCLAPMQDKTTLEFRRDTLVRVTNRHGSHGPPMPPWLASFSVPSLFDEVEKAIRSPHIIVSILEYDPTFGVPTRLDTDTAYGGFDGYYRWRISDFQPSR